MSDGAAGPPDHAATSQSLLIRAKGRDETAWNRLVKLYQPLVLTWCAQLGVDRNDVENVVQEVFFAVSRKLDDFERRQNGSFRRWLKTITRNKVLDEYRTAKGNPKLDQTRIEALPSPDPETELSRDQREVNILYHRAVELIQAEYSERDWRLFQSVIIDGRRPADVAADADVSSNVVYLVTSRILKRLRDEFRDIDE